MPEGYTYYSDTCLIFIVTGIICGIIRLVHHCRPYDKEAQYFYPASSLTAFLFMGIIMLTPYYLHPEDPGAWVYLRAFGVVYYPAAFSAAFHRYFKWQRLRGWSATLFFYLPVCLLAVTSIAAMYTPTAVWLGAHDTLVLSIAAGIGIILAGYMMKTLVWLKNQISDYNKGNFSYDSDFPHKFACKIIYFPAIWTAIVWIVLLTDNRDLNMAANIVMSACMVSILCLILHPQRLLRPKCIEEKLDNIVSRETRLMQDTLSAAKEEDCAITESDAEIDPSAEEARRQVLEIILQKYRESHLQKSDILALIDSGKKSEANRFIIRIGYYNLINMFRLEHARLYGLAHPEAKQSEIAEAAGFASGSSFSKAKRSVSQIDPEIVSGVKL